MNLGATAPVPLPESYVKFLTDSNGGEGPLCVQPDWLILYTAEEVAGIETKGTFHEFFPNHFVIGSNGGGEGIALIAGKSGVEKVVYFDMTNSNLEESVVPLAPSFEGLISLFKDHKS